MNRFLRDVRVKVFLLFLIPAFGLLYFSSAYVYENYRKYRDSLYLEKAISYAYKLMDVVKNLQKERGLSIGCLDDEGFCQELNKQYGLTNRAKERFTSFLLSSALEREELFDGLMERLSELSLLREKVKNKELSTLEILDSYSAIIDRLLHSLNILERNYIDANLFRLVISFRKIAQMSEINGKERALISYVIQNGPQEAIFKRLRELEVELSSIQEILKKNMPYKVEILYYKYIPKKFEKGYNFVKQSIIYRKRINIVTKQEWWILATGYIDRLFKIDGAILKMINIYKNRLKEQTFNTLFVSAVLWLVALGAMGIFLKLFSTILDELMRYAKMVELEKRFYKTFSEFSANLLFVKSAETLLNSYAILLMKTGFFKFLFVTECDENLVVLSENIPLSALKKEFPESLKEVMRECSQQKNHKILRAIGAKGEHFRDVRTIGVFPLLFQHRCRYLLVLATREQRGFNVKVTDLILKMNELFGFVLEKFEAEKKESKLKEELKLISHTFDTHEAIVITDKNGNIQRVNRAFEEITGYTEEEVKGKNPSILKSGKHGKEFYEQMWHDIRTKGFWKGEIYNKKKDGTIYPEILSITAIKNEKGEVTNYVSHFFDISDLKAAQAENERRANYDALTDVFNRKKLLEELDIVRNIAIKDGFYNAFLFIDLDNFKQINDSYGHKVGDQVLIEISKRLKSIKKERDIIARLGGDEFAYILVDVAKDMETTTKAASMLAQKLLDEYTKPIKIDDMEFEVGFSIGIYIFPSTEKSAEDIIINADIAMYHSKRNGKNSFTFYNEKLDIESKQFLYMKKEIEKGLKNREFKLHYQPKVDIHSGEIVGFEALLRWESPTMGMLYPDTFLTYAYGNNLLNSFTDYVIEEVYQTLDEWKEEGQEVRISINISTEQFNNRAYMNRLLELTKDPLSRYICFEIVEDAFVRDADMAIELIEEFRKNGIKFAIDDFGTGYSSLNYLRRLPVDEIKIDKSFVIDLFSDNNDKIVKKIVEISKVFGFEVTAEGVENARSVEFLRAIGCDYFQGFYFSRPVPKEEARKMLEKV